MAHGHSHGGGGHGHSHSSKSKKKTKTKEANIDLEAVEGQHLCSEGHHQHNGHSHDHPTHDTHNSEVTIRGRNTSPSEEKTPEKISTLSERIEMPY
jgi:hypothetical protein